jgi:amino acid adenylation domain-containing protein
MDVNIYLEKGTLKIDSPEGMVLDTVIPKIKANRAELISYLSQQGKTITAIPVAPEQESYALSSSQRRLWVLSQFAESNIAYNMPGVYVLEGSLDVNALIWSFNKLIERHEILRTVFAEDEYGEIKQFIKKSADARFEIACIDLRNEIAQDARLRQLLDDAVAMPFNLGEAPLLRAALYQMDANKWVLGYQMHHIISDGWSMNILFKELLQLYYACTDGNVYPLQPLRIQYKDYSAWQQNGPLHKDYWLQQLGGDLPVLELLNDKPRPSARTYNGNVVTKVVPTGLTQRMKVFCSKHDGSLFMGLLAAVNVLLHRYTGQDDIIIGTPIANRDHFDLKDQLGFYANTLALRAKFKTNDSFTELFRHTRQVALDAYEHQSFAFDELIDVLGVKHDASRHPLFDVMMQLQPRENREYKIGDLHISRLEGLSHTTSKFDLLFDFIEEDECLLVRIEYNTDIFNKNTIERLANHLHQVMIAVTEQPSTPISQLNYLSEAEKQQLLVGFNDTEASYPEEKTLVDLFEEQAAATPENVAVVFEGISLTYRALNERSNRLANYLSHHYAVQPDDLVGIQLQRSELMIVSMLAVLKSGGAYVPIDPEYPQDRIDYMIADSQCKAVIDENELLKFENEKEQHSDNNPVVVNKPGNIAYVIYTSGTTGKPKGSLVEHRNVVRLLKTDKQLFDFNEHDVWTMFHSFCFDFSVWEIYGAILFGGRVVVIPSLTAKDPALFLEVLRKEQVTVLNQTPSAFYNLIKEDEEHEASLALRYVIFGGEALSPGKLSSFNKKYPSTELINMYGITETTVHVTYKRITEKEITNNSSNIGKPIPTLSCYILDQQQQLLPVGVAGELYVGGDGVCRGYLNRPELTAKKFIDNPFKSGERLYRSGDKAKLLENGEMEYGGRLDDQVKIRGYRIELGEIESAFRRINKIENVVIIAKADAKGDTNLIAYLVSNEKLNTTELRQELATQLPSYMLPAFYIQLEHIPLTSNGKVNRKMLPDPEGLGIDTGTAYVAPRNATEGKLVAIWQEILGREQISVFDNFFEIGGHSLKATRLASQLFKQFQTKIELKELFRKPVLEEQARYIDQSKNIIYSSIEPVAVQADYALSSAQQRLWVLSQFEEANVAYNIPAVYTFKGNVQPEALEYSFNKLIERHESLRTIFKTGISGEVRQHILTPEQTGFKISYHDLRGELNAEENAAAIIETAFLHPFDLAAGPLLRVSLYQVSANEYLFSYVMHHIISDGWSMGVLVKEVLQHYNAFVNGDADVLSPLTIQYKDYAAWQERQTVAEPLSAHKNYWLQQFEGELPLLELPSDKTRPAIKKYSGDVVCKTISNEITNGLRLLAKQQGSTLFMALTAAVNVLLHRYTGQQDIIIGTQMAGRDHYDLENQIGLYLNPLALRAKFNGSDSYNELVSNIRKTALEAYEHQLYPFDELVDALQLRHNPGRNPLFDITVVLHNTENKEASGTQSGNLLVQEYEGIQLKTSRFDLSFDFNETGDVLQANFVYNTDIFNRHTIERLSSHFERLLSAIIAEPETPISQLNYLSEAEKQQLLFGFNDTEVDYPQQSIAALFAGQVAKNPGKTAVVFGKTQLTYKELDEQSNRLANYLKENYNTQPGECIGIMLERSEKLIIAILGVLKSGAAYVPIDPEYPSGRKSFMLQDTSAKLLITQSDYLFGLDYYQGDVFAIDVQLDTINASAEAPVLSSSANDLAYVMYTSGSTGTPKGVMVEQRGVARLVKSANYVSFSENEVLLSTGAVSFDATTFEYWGMLLNGGGLVFCSKETLLDEQRLAAIIEEQGVSMMWFTAGWLNQLVDKNIALFKGLRTIVAGGDKLSPYHINALRTAYPDVRIVNGYGPTENTTFSLTYEIASAADNIPVGKPISNSTAYIIDKNNQLCPVGVVGEICVGGDGLARGYLNNEALTSEKFVAHPSLEGKHIYRTGDLGKWQADGNIAFIGRKDEQVKIRGYRIELGEIENALQSYTGIESAVVIVKGSDAEKELVAYIVSSEELNAADIRSHVSQSLPAYMLPDHFVSLDELPLNSNGKVDRKQLPDAAGAAMEAGTMYVAPRNETEERLVKIWQEILGKDQVSVTDNFFEIGGHSLKATRVISQVQKEFDVNISLGTLFTNPTIEHTALEIEKIYWANNEVSEESEVEKFVI